MSATSFVKRRIGELGRGYAYARFLMKNHFHTIRNILSQLGLADVKAFGLDYQDCEDITQKLGYTLEVRALSVA